MGESIQKSLQSQKNIHHGRVDESLLGNSKEGSFQSTVGLSSKVRNANKIADDQSHNLQRLPQEIDEAARQHYEKYTFEEGEENFYDAVKGTAHNLYQDTLNSYSRDNLQGLDPEAIDNSPRQFAYGEGNANYDSKNNSKESLSPKQL